MTRQPSIHITEEALVDILCNVDIPLSRLKIKTLAKQILKMGRKHSLSSRKMLAVNKTIEKKAERMLSANIEDTVEMNKIIFQYRKSKKHRGIEMISAGSRQYPILKTITKNAVDFFTDNEDHFTSKKSAMVKYIELADSIMSNFNITRIPSCNERIYAKFEAESSLRTNKDTEYTDRSFAEYVRRVIDRTGVLIDNPKDSPEEMVYFMKVAERCREVGCTPEVYIQAQFEALDFCNGIPTCQQLMSAKSMGYLQKYWSKNKRDAPQKAVNVNVSNRLKNLKNL